MKAVPDVEIWLPVIGWSELYEVPSLGRVRSLDRVSVFTTRQGKVITRRLKGRVLRQCIHQKRGGYPTVGLHRDGVAETHFVHRLVCEAFHGVPTSPLDVAHNDGDPAHNRPENLRWATRKENMADTISHGTRSAGERHGGHKLSDAEVAEIRALTGIPQNKIARRYGVVQSHISNIKNSRRRIPMSEAV